jgi:PAS domain S-box-containing protein
MESYSLLCEHKDLRVFAQFQQVFQIVNALIQEKKASSLGFLSSPAISSDELHDKDKHNHSGHHSGHHGAIHRKTDHPETAGELTNPQASNAKFDADKESFYNESQDSQSSAPEYLLRSVLESASIGIVSVDSVGKVIYFNKKFADIWEIPTEILLTQEHSQYMTFCQSKVKSAKKFSRYLESISQNAELAGVKTIELVGGQTLQQAFQPLYFSCPKVSCQEVGRIWGYLETTQPESLPQSTSQSTSQSTPHNISDLCISDILTSQFLKWASFTDTLLFITCNGCIVYANRKAQTVSGYSQSALTKHPQFQAWVAQLIYQTNHQTNQQPNHQINQIEDYKFTTESGQDIWLQATATTFRLGTQQWALISASDVSVLKQKEINILELLLKEKALSQKRQQLASTITHRSINSLTYMLGATDVLEMYYDKWDAHKREMCISKLRATCKQLQQFITRLKEVCQIITDKTADPNSLTDVYGACWNLTEQFKQRYPHHAFVSLNLAESTLAPLDSNLLKIVLFNLLENASKYSLKRSLIKLVVYRESASITFRIHDTGIGILKTEREHLIKPFYRGSNVGDQEGLGLGLTIVEALLAVQGAQINLSENSNQGTIASVTFPLNKHPPDYPPSHTRDHTHGVKQIDLKKDYSQLTENALNSVKPRKITDNKPVPF